MSAPFVRHLLTEHQSGRRDNTNRLWSLLVLECGSARPPRADLAI